MKQAMPTCSLTELATRETHSQYHLRRADFHFMPIVLPRLKPDELLAALQYKLRASYPGAQQNPLFLVQWIAFRKEMRACVYIVRATEAAVLPEALSTQELLAPLPLRIPPAWGKLAVFVGRTTEAIEISVFRDGLLADSILIGAEPKVVQATIERLVGDGELPAVYLLNGDQYDASGLSDSVSFEVRLIDWDDFSRQGRFEPLTTDMQFREFPLRKVVLLGASAFLILTSLMVAVVILVSLNNDLSGLDTELSKRRGADANHDTAVESRQALEKKLSSLRGLRGLPVLSMVASLSKLQSNGLILDGIQIDGSRLRLSGTADNAVAALELVRQDSRLAKLQPTSIQRSEKQGREVFVFEGPLQL